MTEIYLIRHTEAEGNYYRIMQGQWDGGVTETGKKEVELLAERFRDIKVDTLWSSDLYRTRYTASAITKYHDIPLQTSLKLREINVGPWETKFFADAAWSDPQCMHDFIFDAEHWYLEGAEDYHQVEARGYAEIERIAAENDGKTVVIVSHGVTIRTFLGKALGVSLNDTRKLPISDNTAVSHLFYENGSWKPDYINDASHLVPLNLPKWNSVPELRAECMDPAENRDYYTACYTDAWLASHGNLKEFTPAPYLSCAVNHYKASSKNVLRLLERDKPAGLVELDSERDPDSNYLWVVLLYLNEEYRHRNAGRQVLGRAVARAYELGRSRLRLSVAAENTAAINFYQKNGFTVINKIKGAGGGCLIMELDMRRVNHA